MSKKNLILILYLLIIPALFACNYRSSSDIFVDDNYSKLEYNGNIYIESIKNDLARAININSEFYIDEECEELFWHWFIFPLGKTSYYSIYGDGECPLFIMPSRVYNEFYYIEDYDFSEMNFHLKGTDLYFKYSEIITDEIYGVYKPERFQQYKYSEFYNRQFIFVDNNNFTMDITLFMINNELYANMYNQTYVYKVTDKFSEYIFNN